MSQVKMLIVIYASLGVQLRLILMKMEFIGMSKREALKAIEGREIVRITYIENAKQVPKDLIITLKDENGKREKYWLGFDKHSRRISTQF